MKDYIRTSRKGLFFFLFLLVIGVIAKPQEVEAGTFDHAVHFYEAYGNNIVFKDGYFYYGSRGKVASATKNTTLWSTLGYRMNVWTSSSLTHLYFTDSSYMVETCSHVSTGGYFYELYRIHLSHVKSQLSIRNWVAYEEFLQSGANISVDNCMTTIWVDRYGNRYPRGTMDAQGNFSGLVYTDYQGIANAANWSNPSSLHSYFSKQIHYVTPLKLKQEIYVRYQQADGSMGQYKAVLSKDYIYGQQVTWSLPEDKQYQAASVSYTVTEAKTTHVTVYRKGYDQKVYVKYMDEKGSYGKWELVQQKRIPYGGVFSYSYEGNACYQSATVEPYVVTGNQSHYLLIARNQYTVKVEVGEGIASVSGGDSYYYGERYTIDAKVKTGYTWNKWSGFATTTTKKASYLATSNRIHQATAVANQYQVVFHSNGGSGAMAAMTCRYDQIYTLPKMTFQKPDLPSTYVGWNQSKTAFTATMKEQQRFQNLTAKNHAVIHLYAIWDYAPELSTSDRYFTLYEAKTGVITEVELLRTAIATDREQVETMVYVKHYMPSLFTSVSKDTTIPIVYVTVDREGNQTESSATISITDTALTKEEEVDFDGYHSYARFIHPETYRKSYEEGGVEPTSLWRSDPSYGQVLEKAMANQ